MKTLFLAITIFLASIECHAQSLCVVSDTLKNQNGGVLINSPVRVFGAVLASTKTPIDQTPIEYRSNGQGIVSFPIYRNATVWIQANYMSYSVTGGRHVVIPNTATALLKNLSNAP